MLIFLLFLSGTTGNIFYFPLVSEKASSVLNLKKKYKKKPEKSKLIKYIEFKQP